MILSALLAQLFVMPFLLAEDSDLPLVKDLPVDVKEKCFTLLESEVKNDFKTSFTLASLPKAYICGVGVEVSIIGDARFNLKCKLDIAGQIFEFDLDDPAVYFKLDFKNIKFDGKLDPTGLVKFSVTVDTDGILENAPKLVFYHYSLDFE